MICLLVIKIKFFNLTQNSIFATLWLEEKKCLFVKLRVSAFVVCSVNKATGFLLNLQLTI